MRSTMFSGNKKINPSNIFDLHIKNLEILINSLSNKSLTSDMTNPELQEYIPTTMNHDVFEYSDIASGFLIVTFENAIAGLKRMRDVANEFNPPLTDGQINELVSIPAISKTWDMMMKYKPLQFMNPNLERLTLSTLDNASKAREDKITQLQNEIDRLRQEKKSISDLHAAIIKRQLPFAEFNKIKKKVDKINAERYSLERNNDRFRDICKIIATSEDPELTFQQTYAYINSKFPRNFTGNLTTTLDLCHASKGYFNSFFGEYGYHPDNTPRQVSNPDRFGRYGEYDRQIHPGYNR